MPRVKSYRKIRTAAFFVSRVYRRIQRGNAGGPANSAFNAKADQVGIVIVTCAIAETMTVKLWTTHFSY